MFKRPAERAIPLPVLATILAVNVPYANRVPPTAESHKFQPVTVCTTVAVALLLPALRLVTLPCGLLAGAIPWKAPLTNITRLLTDPSEAPLSLGIPFAQLIHS